MIYRGEKAVEGRHHLAYVAWKIFMDLIVSDDSNGDFGVAEFVQHLRTKLKRLSFKNIVLSFLSKSVGDKAPTVKVFK
ncbi:hypothetical protein MUK42_35827 [Musa troglodytarum]|uniref:Uncharacterized protein n=1 Tax=Musa troglodytarum TaxID=320322 RepID=A0A9E7JCR0_9LILI|nr:hypothetical protein MUK42_35827 [Musa troglodytarum]